MSDHHWTTFDPSDLRTAIVGRKIGFFRSVGSTNDLLKAEARSGALEGLVFVTDEQVAGRGRRGRTWTAPAGSSLLVSILLRPHWLPASDGFLLTMLAAVAAAEALETTEVRIDLKWPNDLEIGGRKLGGILVETELSDQSVNWAVIGCGININWDPRIIPELADRATSLGAELQRDLDRRPLLAALLRRLDARYAELRRGARSALFEAWRNRLTMLGQAIRVETPQGTLHGSAVDVTRDGALVVRGDDGEQRIITAGDVSVRTML